MLFLEDQAISICEFKERVRRIRYEFIGKGVKVVDKNVKLECMRRRQQVLFGIAGRLIMVASFAVGFCHDSPPLLANASFLFRRSTFRVISLETRVPHCRYYNFDLTGEFYFKELFLFRAFRGQKLVPRWSAA